MIIVFVLCLVLPTVVVILRAAEYKRAVSKRTGFVSSAQESSYNIVLFENCADSNQMVDSTILLIR